MTAIFIFFIATWYLSLFFQTFFLHRYSAHKAFTMSKRTEKVFYFLTWFFQGPNYLSPYGYGVMHRMHHAFADTPQDPHSPKYDESIWKMMWKTKTIYSDITNKVMDVEARFTDGVPDWQPFDKFARSWYSRLTWGALYVAFYYQFATVWWIWLLLPVQLLFSPIHGAIINWFAHKYGYRNFEVGDTSRNFLPLDFLMMGESYHNNHHANGNSPNFGVKWHELDPTYFMIKLLNGLGVINIKKSKSVKLNTLKKAA
ncbi:MAG: acyl-CoA desaturase [Cyclobacteriaceae bacterium]|nr:acyl-CoA desaturase [Cyclobacteriaceae bacterium]